MTMFKAPQVVLFSRDLTHAAGFYSALGFEEVFRTPTEGSPIHVDLVLDGYRIGLASEDSTRNDHGLEPVATGQRAAVILWTEDTPAAYSRLLELGATPVKGPEPWLDRLLIAWVGDPDGHLIQIVQSTEVTPR